MRAIVFGSNGYIGMHLVHTLLKMNWEVRSFDVQPTSAISTSLYASIDITYKHAVDQLDLDVDLIFLFSGITGTGNAYERYESFIDVNEKGILHLLSAVKQQKVKPRIVFPSTRLVYKGIKSIPLHEESEKECKSIYALNKLFCESILSQYYNYFGVDYTVFRICVPYGNLISNNFSYGTLGFFINNAKAGKNISLYGDGYQARTFSFVGDICKAIITASLEQESSNQVYNIGGETFTLKDVALMVASKFGVGIDFIPWPELELKMESGDTIFNSQKLDSLIGRYQTIQLREWIDRLSI
jgi:UDP-glucose 4-epimerase